MCCKRLDNCYTSRQHTAFKRLYQCARWFFVQEAHVLVSPKEKQHHGLINAMQEPLIQAARMSWQIDYLSS